MEETKKTFKDWLESPERIEMAKAMEESRKHREMENDYWWNNELTEEQREKAFYAVCKRIHKSDICDRGSYRWALYDVFKFDMGMYGDGMDSGYMDIHNFIQQGIELKEMLKTKKIRISVLGKETVASMTSDMEFHIKLNDKKEVEVFFGMKKDYLDNQF